MKRILAAAIALTLVGGSAAMADPHGHGKGHDKGDRAERHHDRDDHKGYKHGKKYKEAKRHDNGLHRGHHKWAKGQRLPYEYRRPVHYVDYRVYHLNAPPRGYHWVQVDDDYLMVARATGLIASIIARN